MEFLPPFMFLMGSLPPYYTGTLELILGISDILTSLISNIPPSLPPPPEVEEGRQDNGYFVLGTLVGHYGIRDPSMFGLTNVNAQI